MLEQGQSVADVLWYLGDDVDHKPRQDSPFPSGYHFDYLNADALLSRLSVEDEDLIVANGSRWRVLWLPREQCRRLTPKTLTKIKELLNAGATVIGEAPDLNPSLSGGAAGDQAFDALIQSLWGTAESSSGDQPVGKGRLLWGGDLKTSLAKLDLLPDVDGTLPEKWSHRRTEDADIYFVIGGRNQSLDANLHFRATGKPEFWDPIDGSIKPVSVCKQTETCTTIPIRLPVAGSTFVVFRSPHKVPKSAPPTTKPWQRISLDGQSLQDATNLSRSDTAAGFPKFGISRTEPIQPWVAPDSLDFELRDGGQKLVAWTNGQFVLNRAKGEPFTATVTGARSIPLLNDWMLLLPDGWDTPKSIKLGRVGPWSALEEKNTRHFSGTATYRKTFTFEGLEDDQRLMLDLGRVGNIADVRLNAKAAGVLWAAPYRKDITEFVRPGENVVEISVTNTWHNRLAYDQSQPKANRKTWTIKPPPANATLEFSGLESVHLHFGKVVQLPVP
jgi:hypothetical protein